MVKINCKVCNVETTPRIKCGALVCEACKRFFIRHRTITKPLHCHNGNGHCLEIQGDQAELTPKGVVWRHMCTACRFQKCLRVGMTRGPREVVANNSTSSLETPMEVEEQFEPKFNIARLIEICQIMEQEQRKKYEQELLEKIAYLYVVNQCC